MKFEYEKDECMLTFWVCKYFGFCVAWLYWRELPKTGVFEFVGLYIQPCVGVLGIGLLNLIFGIRWLK